MQSFHPATLPHWCSLLREGKPLPAAHSLPHHSPVSISIPVIVILLLPSLLLPQFLLRNAFCSTAIKQLQIIWLCPTNCSIRGSGGMLFADCVGSSYSLFSGFLILSHLWLTRTEHSSGWYLYTHSQHWFLLMCKDIYGSGEKGQPALVEDELEKTKNPLSGAEPGAQQLNTNTAISWDLHGNKHSTITKMFPGRFLCVAPCSRPCNHLSGHYTKINLSKETGKVPSNFFLLFAARKDKARWASGVRPLSEIWICICQRNSLSISLAWLRAKPLPQSELPF